MKIRLTFKTPDVTDCINDLPEDDQYAAENAIRKWVKYGEYLNVDIDTETGECTPIEVKIND